MSFSAPVDLGTGNSTTNGTSLVLATSAVAEANKLVVLIIGLDNTQTTDGQTSEISSIADSAGGNTWTKAGEFCNGETTAGAGAVVSVWFSKLTNQINSGGTITATLANSRVAKAMTANKYTIDTSNSVQVASGSLQTLADDGTDPGNMTISGLTSKEYLFVRASAQENNAIGVTNTTNYTLFSEALANTGITTDSILACGEFRILTGTGDSSNIMFPGAGFGSEAASVYFALEEVSGAQSNLFAFF